MMRFPAPMVALMNQAELWPANRQNKNLLIDALNLVKKEQNGEKAKFEITVQGWKKGETLSSIIEDIRGAFAQQEQALDQIEAIFSGRRGNMEEALDTLEAGISTIGQAFALAAAIESKVKFSDFPLINDMIQAALNVNADNEPAEILIGRMALTVRFIGDLEREAELYMEVRPQAVPWGAYINESMEGVKSGLGAIQTYLDEHKKINLLAGAYMLQEHGKRLAFLFKDMYEKTEKLFTFSPISEIERLWLRRGRYRQGMVTAEYLQEAIARVGLIIQDHVLENAIFQAAIMPDVVKEYYKSNISQLLEREKYYFENLNDDDNTLLMLKQSMEQFLETFMTAVSYAKQYVPALNEAPNFKELRDIILGVYEGTIPKRTLRRVNAFLSQELINLLEQEDMEPRAQEALQYQQRALQLVDDYLENGNRSSLEQAIEPLEHGTLRLIEFYQAKMTSDTDGPTVSCLKCGCANPMGTTHCVNCKAYIPFAKAIDAQNSNINISENVQQENNIKKLEDLVTNVIYNQNDPPSVGETVEPILLNAKKVWEALKNRPAEAVSKDELDPKDFLEATEAFIGGLEEMIRYDVDRDISRINRGLEKAKKAAEKMMTLANPSAAPPADGRH